MVFLVFLALGVVMVRNRLLTRPFMELAPVAFDCIRFRSVPSGYRGSRASVYFVPSTVYCSTFLAHTSVVWRGVCEGRSLADERREDGVARTTPNQSTDSSSSQFVRARDAWSMDLAC